MATPTAHTAPAHTATAPGRVLVTGLGGFTERYVQTALEQRGWEVWGLGAARPCRSGHCAAALPASRPDG